MLWVPSAGSMTPRAVGNSPSYAQKQNKTKKNTHIKLCLCTTSATMTDLQADHGVDTFQGVLNINSTVHALTKKDTRPQVAILDSCFAGYFLNLVSACQHACQHNLSALSVRSVPSVWLCDRLSLVPFFNLSSQYCRVFLFSSISPAEHVHPTISIFADSHPQRLASRQFVFILS